jgi:hypothetical protein
MLKFEIKLRLYSSDGTFTNTGMAPVWIRAATCFSGNALRMTTHTHTHTHTCILFKSQIKLYFMTINKKFTKYQTYRDDQIKDEMGQPLSTHWRNGRRKQGFGRKKKLKGRYFRIIKESWVRRMLRGGLHWYSSPQEPFAGSLGHGNEYPIRIKYGEYTAALCDYQLFHLVCTKTILTSSRQLSSDVSFALVNRKAEGLNLSVFLRPQDIYSTLWFS